MVNSLNATVQQGVATKSNFPLGRHQIVVNVLGLGINTEINVVLCIVQAKDGY